MKLSGHDQKKYYGAWRPRARLSALKGICDQRNKAGEGVYMLNVTNQSFFGKSVGPIELQHAPKFSR